MKNFRRIVGLILTACCMCVFSIAPVFAGAIDETEPNNSVMEASNIYVGSTVYGYTTEDDKFDYFKFTAPISGTVKVDIWADYTNYQPEVNYAFLRVLDSNNKIIDEAYDLCTTSRSDVAEIPVSYGKTYYLRVCGDYYGFCEPIEYHLKATYSVGKTSITSVKGKKNSFTVNWNKKSKASFYQVQYVKKSSYADYGWSKAKTIKMSSEYGSKTIKKLSKKTAYYVRVRVGRKISGKVYYSAWSSKKYVKTK